jgi:DNA-binding NtrC family response regulator
MHETKANLLIVDDEPSIRMSLSHVLGEMGYRVRTAEDGVAALIAINDDVPDVLLSDLNMPGMSGFELLAKVRRQFPATHTIAMSGAFCGNEVPSGVAADAFYQKGSSLGSLLMMIENLPGHEQGRARPPTDVTLLAAAQDGHHNLSDACTSVRRLENPGATSQTVN